MEDELKKIKNERRPQKKIKMEDDLKKMGKNGRQPKK